MKELDVLLERFARQALPQAPPEDWDSFESLLALPDPVLAGYLLAGDTPREARTAAVVIQVRQGMNFYPPLQSTRSGSAR
ncbi:MAG: succinate dehydrogenase assembly factor 2 [Proteobacteria bacterium]|nr:succinate dehydrogenase assembly factor 2 [Pseudomonadota bacterium]